MPSARAFASETQTSFISGAPSKKANADRRREQMLRVKLATGLLGAAASAAAWANIAPTVAITGLADGASYQEGATVFCDKRWIR